MTNINDETLLRELAAYNRHFDASTIRTWVLDNKTLFDALAFLRRRPNKADEPAGRRRLNETSLRQIRRWFTRVEGRSIAGLVLVRDRLGWCSVNVG